MKAFISDPNHSYLNDAQRNFLLGFDKLMCEAGYAKKAIGDFNRWGNDTMAYFKPNAKTSVYSAKVEFSPNRVSLRIYLRKIEKHLSYLENAPAYILENLTNVCGNCVHCSDNADGNCKHRKTYTLMGNNYEKCDGQIFYMENFWNDTPEKYVELIQEFEPIRKTNKG